MDLGLAGRVYVVTGGSRGLGLASAAALVADGASVVVSARHLEPLSAAVELLGRTQATGEVADLADPDTPDRLVDAALSTYGRLDGALVSVGGPPADSVLDTSDEAWSRAFDSVFLGALRMTRVTAAALGEGGSIAMVLSSSAKSPLPGLAISNGLRPGLAMLVKSLADELGPRGIRVNGLLPGRVDTDRVRELDSGAADPAAAREEHQGRIPLRRYGRPAEFGHAAAFMLAPASSYVTGILLPVDGGALRAL